MASVAPTLHVTNGSAIIPMMREAGIEGPIVPWDDVLHEGPVPAGLGTAALRERRTDFLASCGWGTRSQIERDLEARDGALDSAIGVHSGGAPAPPGADEIVLWFEHDLYDQLQLLQILDRVPVDGEPRVTGVFAGTYLGALSAAAYPDLYAGRRLVSSAERMAARDAWTAFRSADPRGIVDVLPRVTVLPHLGPALRRYLEQFPSIANGLSRTEQQTLEAVARGATGLSDVYVAAHQNREEAVFMGDAGFLAHITPLFQSACPLLKRSGNELALTTEGETVLSGDADRVELCGIDRWLGGVYLNGHGPVWRWDRNRPAVRFV